jgi:hypothetical protein
MVLMSMYQAPFEVHWRNEKLGVAEPAQRHQFIVALIRADRLSAYMYRSAFDIRGERDDQVMFARLLEILILRPCSRSQRMASSKRFTKNGPPFRFRNELRRFFEWSPLDT